MRAVWTGSENWSGVSFLNDELTLHLSGDTVHSKYVKHFNRLWNRHTHPHGGLRVVPRAATTGGSAAGSDGC